MSPQQRRHWRQLLGILLLGSLVSARKVTNPAKKPKNAILLSKVATLTLREGKLTSSRRVDPVPQLSCVGPEDICDKYNVDIMRCSNDGADYDEESIQWSCTASLPPEFKLGSTEVICEGYESSDDPYVLKGSCGVEYRLALTDLGVKKYENQQTTTITFATPAYDRKVDEPTQPTTQPTESSTGGRVFLVVFFGVLGFILYSMWQSYRQNAAGGNTQVRRPPRSTTNYGGGHRRDDDDDPPPPYDDSFSPPTHGTFQKQGVATSSTRSSSSRGTSQQQTEAWRPGLLTGVAAGAVAGSAAGYLARRRSSRNSQTQQQQQPASQQPEVQQRPNAWSRFLGQPSAPASSSRQSSSTSNSSSSSGPSYSASRYESTGFGGTSRR